MKFGQTSLRTNSAGPWSPLKAEVSTAVAPSVKKRSYAGAARDSRSAARVLPVSFGTAWQPFSGLRCTLVLSAQEFPLHQIFAKKIRDFQLMSLRLLTISVSY